MRDIVQVYKLDSLFSLEKQAIHTEKTLGTGTQALFFVDQGIPEKLQQTALAILQKIYQHVEMRRLPGGEACKSFQAIEKIIEYALCKNITLDWDIIAFGGGAFLDAIGFFSSIYLRGALSYFSIPTTLLAMTDAALGGKNGINMQGIKNCVGTCFYPKATYIIPSLLDTYPPHDLLISSMEMWKHALLTSSQAESEYQILARQLLEQKEYSKEQLSEEIWKSVERKTAIVSESQHFPEKRHLLNLGHTIAHALEAGFQGKISHGVAVLYGIVVESLLGKKQGITVSQQLLDREQNFLQSCKNAIDLSGIKRDFHRDIFIESLYRDKKNIHSDQPMIVLLTDFGMPYQPTPGMYRVALSQESIDWAVHWIEEHILI